MGIETKINSILIQAPVLIKKSSIHLLGVCGIIIALSFSQNFADNYTPTKWVMTHFFSLCAGILLLFDRNLLLPRLDKQNFLLILALIISYLLSLFLNLNGSYISQYSDWLSFFFILLSSSNSIQKKEDLFLLAKYFMFGGLTVTVIGVLQMLEIELFPSVTHNEFPSSTFGFQNMTAEFIGLVIVLQIFVLNSKVQSKKFIYLIHILLTSLQLSYLYLLSCRSCLLALMTSLFFLIFKGDKLKKIKLLISVIVSAALFIFILNNVNETTKKTTSATGYFSGMKESNTKIRLTRWRNTLYMIAENPFGVGPGNYEYGYIPYQNSFSQDLESTESMVVRSPHNGFLEAAAENGWACLLILIVFLLACLIKLLKEKNFIFEESHYLILAVFSFILVDAMFAFPMEGAFPFFVAALFIGHFFKVTTKEVLKVNGIIFLPAVLALAFFSYKYGSSKFNEKTHFNNFEKQLMACEYLPENWRACLRASDLATSAGNINKSIELLEGILKRQENNFAALSHLAFVYLEQGKIDSACITLERYLKIYSNSFIASERDKICSQ